MDASVTNGIHRTCLSKASHGQHLLGTIYMSTQNASIRKIFLKIEAPDLVDHSLSLGMI